MKVSFEVPFVKGKERPRFDARSGAVYTPSGTKKYQKAVTEAYVAAGGPMAPDGAPVTLFVTTLRPLPKTRPLSVETEPDTHKPDLDNVVKLVEDALIGVAYRDDSQVTKLFASKADRCRGVEAATYIDVVWEEEDEPQSEG